MDSERPTVAPIDQDDEPALRDLWNSVVVGRSTAELRTLGIEVQGDRMPNVAHLLIHRAAGAAGATLAITIIGHDGWAARPPLNFKRLDSTLKDAARRVEHCLEHLDRGRRRDRGAVLDKLETVCKWLMAEVEHVSAADPNGILASWREIPEAEPISVFWTLVRQLPVAGAA